MFMQQDWLMRQIELVTMVLAKLLFGKSGETFGWEYAIEDQQTQTLMDELTGLLRQGQLGAAEDLLFAQFLPGSKKNSI